MTKLTIPPGVDFADLQLEIATDGRLLFLPAPLIAFVHHNNGDADAALGDEDSAMHWISEWYAVHRTTGGDADPVAEEILAEVAALQASDIPALQPGGEWVH